MGLEYITVLYDVMSDINAYNINLFVIVEAQLGHYYRKDTTCLYVTRYIHSMVQCMLYYVHVTPKSLTTSSCHAVLQN